MANDGVDLGILIGLRSRAELAIHTRGTIDNGLTEVEIREAVLQAAIYCGGASWEGGHADMREDDQ